VFCTVGPACRSPKKLLELIQGGMDVARLHFSYGDQTEHAENIKRLHHAATAAGQEIEILQDLSGTKVRMLDFAEDRVELRKGAEFILTSRKVIGSARRVSVNIPELLSVVEPGDTVLLADGALKLEVVAVTKLEVRCKVVLGGRIKSQQAVHVPGKAAPVRVPTAKDRNDIVFGIRHGVNWIAQSFASTAAEIVELRRFIRRHGATIPVVVKIERLEALANLDELIHAADAVMVARGDLGLSLPLEEITFAQKEIIRRSNAAGKPVITATEMLFSMMNQPRPTRAEVADITNAILDGSDGVMLSGETAMGKYPIEAAGVMARIAVATDKRINECWRPGKEPVSEKEDHSLKNGCRRNWQSPWRLDELSPSRHTFETHSDEALEARGTAVNCESCEKQKSSQPWPAHWELLRWAGPFIATGFNFPGGLFRSAMAPLPEGGWANSGCKPSPCTRR